MSENVGFPQLDMTFYPSQAFWLAVTFVLMYILMSKVALPRVGRVIEKRRLKRQTDLGKAKEYNDQAAYLKGDYESSLENAHTKAAKTVVETEIEIKHQISERKSALIKDEMAKLKVAEANILQTRNIVLNHINEVAAELVKAMASKVANVDVNTADARASVDSIHKES